MNPRKDAEQPNEVAEAWGRFERAVDAAVKSGPIRFGKHKAKVNTKASPSKKRWRQPIGLARKAEKDS